MTAPEFWIWPALALVAAWVAYRWPLGSLLLLLVSNPIDLPVSVGRLTIYSNEIILTGLFLGAFARLARARNWNSLRSPALLWSLPFLLAVAVSAVNAGSLFSVVKQELRWLQLILVIGYAAQSVQSREDLARALECLIGLGVVVSLFGLVQTLAGPAAPMNAGMEHQTLYANTVMRARGTFGHSNQLAGYLICILPVTFIQWTEAGRPVRRWALAACLGVMGLTLLFTFTRGAWVALALVSVGLVYLSVPRKIFWIMALGLALGLGALTLNRVIQKNAGGLVGERISSIGNPGQDDSAHFRQVCVQTAFKMFERHPWVGFGAGEYGRNIREYFDSGYYAWEAINKHIHNLYLQILVETGLLGFAAFLVWIIALLWIQAKASLARPAGRGRLVLAGLLAGQIAFLIHNQFDVLTIFARGIHFGVIAGLGLAAARMETKDIN